LHFPAGACDGAYHLWAVSMELATCHSSGTRILRVWEKLWTHVLKFDLDLKFVMSRVTKNTLQCSLMKPYVETC